MIPQDHTAHGQAVQRGNEGLRNGWKRSFGFSTWKAKLFICFVKRSLSFTTQLSLPNFFKFCTRVESSMPWYDYSYLTQKCKQSSFVPGYKFRVHAWVQKFGFVPGYKFRVHAWVQKFGFIPGYKNSGSCLGTKIRVHTWVQISCSYLGTKIRVHAWVQISCSCLGTNFVFIPGYKFRVHAWVQKFGFIPGYKFRVHAWVQKFGFIPGYRNRHEPTYPVRNQRTRVKKCPLIALGTSLMKHFPTKWMFRKKGSRRGSAGKCWNEKTKDPGFTSQPGQPYKFRNMIC
jgi:hypothetical protein